MIKEEEFGQSCGEQSIPISEILLLNLQVDRVCITNEFACNMDIEQKRGHREREDIQCDETNKSANLASQVQKNYRVKMQK